MTDKPLVSIITVTYNLIKSGRENSFIKGMECIHNQTYENIEHIVIDGASNDGTLELLKEYEQKCGIKYFSEPDEGIYDAMNKGILKANGKYVAFLNSDDFYHDIKGVEETVKSLEKTNADFSYASCLLLNGQTTNVHNANIYSAFTKTPFMHITMFTKKEVLLKENLFDTKFKIAADYDLIIRLLLKKYKPVFVPLIFASFKTDGISSNIELCANECAKVYYNNYRQSGDITMEECNTFLSNNALPFNLLVNLTSKCEYKMGMGIIFYYLPLFFEQFRKWLIQIRTKKGQETLRILGIYFVKPNSENQNESI